MNARWGCTCMLCTHPHKIACASVLSSRECLTFGRLPVSPTLHADTPQSHLPISWTAVSRDLAKEKDPSVAFLQRSGQCVCVCVQGGGKLLFTRLISAVVLSRALRHTSEGHGCFKCRHRSRPRLVCAGTASPVWTWERPLCISCGAPSHVKHSADAYSTLFYFYLSF